MDKDSVAGPFGFNGIDHETAATIVAIAVTRISKINRDWMIGFINSCPRWGEECLNWLSNYKQYLNKDNVEEPVWVKRGLLVSIDDDPFTKTLSFIIEEALNEHT